MSKINDPNNLKNRLCKNKSINIAEVLVNRIKFNQAHELNKRIHVHEDQISKLDKSLKEFEEALNELFVLTRR